VTGLSRLAFGTVLLVAVALSGGVRAAIVNDKGGGDVRAAQALVVAREDAARAGLRFRKLSFHPCLAQDAGIPAGIPIRGRARSSWGGPSGFLWSVALVAPTPAAARTLYRQVNIEVPPCLVRFWQEDYVPGAVVTLRAAPGGERLGDASRNWEIITRGGETEMPVLHVVTVRIGRAVAYYLYSSPPGKGIAYAIRRTVNRA
jgi:hypothetical protein